MTTRVGWYQKGKTNLGFTEARDSEWQWRQLGHMQVCISLQTDNHASNAATQFFTGRMPFLPSNQQRQSTEGQKELIGLPYKTVQRIEIKINGKLLTQTTTDGLHAVYLHDILFLSITVYTVEHCESTDNWQLSSTSTIAIVIITQLIG